MQWGYAFISPCGRRKSAVSACATKRTGITTITATQKGVFVTSIQHNTATGKDEYRIELRSHGGKAGSVGNGVVLAILAEGEL